MRVVSLPELAVHQVKTVLAGHVAEDVHRPVQVEDSGHLAAHAVVQPPLAVVVDEAVAHPHRRAHPLGDLRCVLISMPVM
eukprot:4508578-Pyramimonas_sp.AAC.1